MLVRDPVKRYTLRQVRKHVWMQADIKAAEAAKDYSTCKNTSASGQMNKPPTVINEQILRVMQSLGIDPVRTAESVKNDSYDHHAAIYYLLQDKLSSSSIVPKSKIIPTGTESGKKVEAPMMSSTSSTHDEIPDHQRRRPSTIAEQVTFNSYTKELQGLRDYNCSTAAAPHPTAFTSNQTQLQQQPQQNQPQQQQHHCWKTPGAENVPPGSPASRMMVSSGMNPTEYNCLTCGLPILENTTSTTTCVKCARLRIRRRNFAQAPPPGVVLHPPVNLQQSGQTPSLEEKQVLPAPTTPCGTAKVVGKMRNDSKDSGVSSGSSQDYDLSTPPVEKTLIFPRFPTPRTDRPSVPFSQLVRKLSEVEGITPNINIVGGGSSTKTSLDEGVVTDVFNNEANDQNTKKILLHQNQHVRSFEGNQGCQSHSYGALAQKAFAATAPSSQTSSCFTSTESYPYESLDENSVQTPVTGPNVHFNVQGGQGQHHHQQHHHHHHHHHHQSGLTVDGNDLTQSLPSCHNMMPINIVEPASEMELTAAVVLDQTYVQQSLMQQHQNYQMVMQHQAAQLLQQQQQQGNMLSVTDASGQRHLMRSPVSFREGRRASDGLVAQAGFVAFQQRLYDKGKAHGLIELHDLHLEHKALQHQFASNTSPGNGSNSSSRSATPDSALNQQQQQPQQSETSKKSQQQERRPSISKRISVPENFTYFPTTSNTDNSKVGILNSSGLQQQLMQHRIYQKRQNMPKACLMLSGSSTRRNLLTRQSGLKAIKPYMPHQDLYCTSASMCGGISNDFLFQPIAEDESDTNVTPETQKSSSIASSASSTGMTLLSVPTCMSMPSSPTPSRPFIMPYTPPTSRTPPVILMEEDVEDVMSIDLTSAQATLTTTSTLTAEAAYWQNLPSHMAESCRLEAALTSPSPSPRRLQPPNKLEVTSVSPSSPNRSPILQTGGLATQKPGPVGPPPLKATASSESTTSHPPMPVKAASVSSPETMDISPK